MKDGQLVMLAPGISTANKTKNNAGNLRFQDILRAITEEVYIISLYNSTGNAKVRDRKGLVFFCNANDLSEINPNFYTF